ncbi:Isoprenyl transferase, partial [Frankliniella fusca]
MKPFSRMFLKNQESKAGFRRIVKTTSNVLPEDHCLPSSDVILKYIQELIPDVVEEACHYCRECNLYIEESAILKDCTVYKRKTDIGTYYYSANPSDELFDRVWYDEVKPNMNTFMKKLCEELKKINENGIEWRHPVTGQLHLTCVRLQLVVADAPARAKMQNIMAHNSKYPCCICEIKTIKCTLQVGMKKRIRVYPYLHNPKLRSKSRMLVQAAKAIDSGNGSEKGVKGVSVLSIIPYVDVSTIFIPEYMHSTLLGCSRQLINILLERKGEWNIEKYSVLIDEDLARIQHPDFVHRFPRQLKNVKNWKASDWYYFLLFELLPILKKYLPVRYYQHLILLVVPIYDLLRRNISEEKIKAANLLLNLFVNQFNNLYPDREWSSNIHSLCHLALCVTRHGPLSCTSAFPFEGMNGTVAKATHGSHNVCQEIVNNLKICQGVQVLEKIKNGLNDLSSSNSSLLQPLGKEVQLNLSPTELSVFKGKSFHIFSRAQIGCNIYTSQIHKKLKSANYYVMWKQKESGENSVGSVKFFAVENGVLCAYVNLFSVDHLNVIFNDEAMVAVEHLIPILESDSACL